MIVKTLTEKPPKPENRGKAFIYHFLMFNVGAFRNVEIGDAFFDAMEVALTRKKEVFWAYFGRVSGKDIVVDKAELVPEDAHSISEELECEVNPKRFKEWVDEFRAENRDYFLVGLGHVHRNLDIPTDNDAVYLSGIVPEGVYSIYHARKGVLRFFRTREKTYAPVPAKILNTSSKYQDVKILSNW